MKIKRSINKNTGVIIDYDENMNMIYRKTGSVEEWFKYDENDNRIYYSRYGYEQWYKYDDQNRLIYSKNTYDVEQFITYNKQGKRINIRTEKNGRVTSEKIFNSEGALIFNKNVLGDNTLADTYDYEFYEE